MRFLILLGVTLLAGSLQVPCHAYANSGTSDESTTAGEEEIPLPPPLTPKEKKKTPPSSTKKEPSKNSPKDSTPAKDTTTDTTAPPSLPAPPPPPASPSKPAKDSTPPKEDSAQKSPLPEEEDPDPVTEQTTEQTTEPATGSATESVPTPKVESVPAETPTKTEEKLPEESMNGTPAKDSPPDTALIPSPPPEDDPTSLSSEQTLRLLKWENDPQFLHTRGILAELNGEFQIALQLLRKASARDPSDELIAFDLARIAILRGGLDEDFETFWNQVPQSDEALLLLYAVGKHLNRPLPGTSSKNKKNKLMTGWVASGVAIDNNISILPDDEPTHTQGVRMVLNTALAFHPLRGPLSIDTGLLLRMNKHLNSEAMGPYDASTGTVYTSFAFDLGLVKLHSVLSITKTYINDFKREYLQALDLQTSLQVPLGSGYISAYGNIGRRDFRTGNPEATISDRDGPLINGGIAWLGGTSVFSIRGKLGYVQKLAQGQDFRYKGANISLSSTLNFSGVAATVGLENELRIYRYDTFREVAFLHGRVDNRSTPFAKLSIPIADNINTYGACTYTKNYSTWATDVSPNNFAYQRSIGEVGIEGQW